MNELHLDHYAGANDRDPARRLRIAVRKMKPWADLNPSMAPLYQEILRGLADVDRYIKNTHHQETPS